MRLHTVLLSFLLAVGGSANLHSKVRHFETLSSSDLNVVSRKKRSVDGSFSHVKQISFNTLGRRFNLVLYPGSPVIGPNFKARTVDHDGRVETFDVNPNNFYTGHLADDSSISVNAHFEDGILSSSIQFPHDTYVVEPAWRHSLPSENQTMISYRGSDVNWEDIYPIDPKTGKRTRMKDGIRLFQKTSAGSERPYSMNESSVDTSDKSRHKRSVGKNTCPLILVADYTFFRDMGNSKRQTTAAFIISSFQAVNQRYRRTVWDSYSGYVNMGFTIDEMLIHTSFSKNPGHYNSDMSWGYNDKLYAFGRMNRLNHFCLGHLFTSHAFPDNVLGLAFIAPESISSAGGICSVTTTAQGGLLYPRCGWSSARNSRNIPVLSLQYELVTTHELGHNWGAEHDPDTSECAPSSHNNGKYLMWPYSVPGYDENNQYFSPCSKRYIAPVLRSKSGYCFREFVEKVTNKTDSSSKPNKTDSSTQTDIRPLCGNGRIEKGEECDIGFTEDDAEDNCCDKKCQLKPGAQCSEFNFPCCTKDCKIAGSDIKCEDRNNLTCKDASFCDGKGLDCPAAGALEDDTPCIDKGLCWQGRCLDFCALIGRKIGKVMTPCLCTQNATAMCRRCCAERNLDNTKGHCLPTTETLDNGRTCYMGTCNDKGVCIKVEQQLAQRIFSFIKDLTVDKLVEFMKTNIVGTVIVLSLIIWIPASCIVSAVDKRKIVEEENDVLRWAFRENAIIGRSREDLANFRIKNSRFTRIPQPPQRNGGVEDLHQRIRNKLQHHLELKGKLPSEPLMHTAMAEPPWRRGIGMAEKAADTHNQSPVWKVQKQDNQGTQMEKKDERAKAGQEQDDKEKDHPKEDGEQVYWKQDGPRENRGQVYWKQDGPRENRGQVYWKQDGPREDRGQVCWKQDGPREDRGQVDRKEDGPREDRGQTDRKEDGPREDRGQVYWKQDGPREDRGQTDRKEDGPREDRGQVDRKEDGPREDRGQVDRKEDGPREDRGQVDRKEDGPREDRGQVDRKEDGPREDRGQVDRKQDLGQVDRKQDSGQVDRKQDSGQVDGKQDSGQVDRKQDSGQVDGKQDSGQVDAKQDGPKEDGGPVDRKQDGPKEDGGQVARKRNGPKEDGQIDRKRDGPKEDGGQVDRKRDGPSVNEGRADRKMGGKQSKKVGPQKGGRKGNV